jgi:hypothetical protein
MILSAHLVTILTHLGYGGFAANVPQSLEKVQTLTNNFATLTNNEATMRVTIDGATCTFEWQSYDRPDLLRKGTLTKEGDTLTFTETFTPRSYSERSHWRGLYAACHQGDDGNFESSVWAELAGSMALPVVIDAAETRTPSAFRERPGRWLDFSWAVGTTDPHLPWEIFRDRPIGPWTSFGLLHKAGRGLGQSVVTPFRRTCLQLGGGK